MTFEISRRRAMFGMAAAVALPSLLLPKGAAAQQGSLLRIRLLENPQVFDPAMYDSESELWIQDAIYPKLITFKAGDAWEWEHYCAESVVQLDEKSVKFVLKPGILWTNGYGEVTSADVKFSYERFIDPKLNAANAPNWSALDHVEIVDKYSGIIHLKQPCEGIFGYILPHDGGQIVCQAAVEKIGGKIGASVPASAGPYQIVEYRSGELIVLERSKIWTGPAPAFDRIEMHPITDTKTAENGVLSGDLDWAVIGASGVPNLRANPPKDLALVIKPTPNFVWLGANMANPSLQDANIRKAIQMAVDRNAILQGAYFGVAEPSYGLALKGTPGYVDTAPVALDIDGARKLINAAGASGTTLQLEVPADSDKITAAQIIQANLAEIGLNVNINQHEEGEFWSLPQTLGKKIQLFYTEWELCPPDVNWITQWFLADQIGGWNWQYFTDPVFAKLHQESSEELDPVKRNLLLLQMQHQLDISYTTYVITHLPRPVLYNTTKIIPEMNPNAAPRLDLFKIATVPS